jgi:hypothetical protein
MTPKDLAAQLTGAEYPLDIPAGLKKEAYLSGLVIIYGSSDDLMEFAGAIDDEVSAYEGTIAFLDTEGLLPDFDQLCEDKDFDGLYGYFRRFPNRHEVEAIWDADGYSWTYKTEIPHEVFEIVEDGEPYCRGIVFALADLPQPGDPQ